MVTHLGKKEDASPCSSVYYVMAIYGVAVWEQYVVEFPRFPYIFYQDWQLSCFLIFLRTTSSSSYVNCLSLMSSWLQIIFVIGSSITFGDFPSKFLKCCSHRSTHPSWLAAFCIAHTLLFLQLTSFTVCHIILDCLSSTETVILLIWSWKCSGCSFRYVLVSSLYAFLGFWALALVGFLLLHRDAVFTSSRFFLAAKIFQGIICLALRLVGMHSTAASMWALTKFSYSSFGVFLISPEVHRICFLVLSCIYRKYLCC